MTEKLQINNPVWWLGISLAMGISVFLLTYRSRETLTICCLDVGQGDGVVIQTPDGRNYVSDFGSSSQNEVGRNILIPYLKHEGISCLDGIFLSHGDMDHISGIEELIEEIQENLTEIRVKHLWVPEMEEPDTGLEELIKDAETAGIQVFRLSSGEKMEMDGICFEILSPEKGSHVNDRNEASMVYQITYGEFQALFTGDIGTVTEKKILSRLDETDFLKIAHHGSGSSTGAAFLDKIKPKVSVISCSEKNRYGHPSPETVRRLEEASVQVYYTMKNGAICLSTDGDQFWVKTFLFTP